MKKILLIRPEPDYPHLARSFPHGLMYLAGYVRSQGDTEVKIIDLRVKTIAAESLEKMVAEYQPDVVGVGLLTLEAQGAHKVAGLVKRVLPQCPVVFGGPHCSAPNAEKILADNNVDFIVIGEGEQTFLELVENICGGGGCEKVSGIALRIDGSVVINPRDALISDLDRIPFPSYDLIDTADYFKFGSAHDVLQSDRKWAPLFTSRGCPYRCIYCHNIFGKKMRLRSPDNIFKEIKWLNSTYGIRNFHIEDDAFNVNMKRAKQLFTMIKDSGLKLNFSFPNGVRADFLDEELVTLFKQGGVYRIAIGIESASPRILKYIKKSLDFNKVRQAIKMITKANISAHGFFMIGFPDETLDEIRETIRFACESKLHTASFNLVIPYPQTEIYAHVNGRKSLDDLDTGMLFLGSADANVSLLPADQVTELRRNAYLRFYLNPLRMWRIFWTTPNKMGLVRNFNVFTKFIRGTY